MNNVGVNLHGYCSKLTCKFLGNNHDYSLQVCYNNYVNLYGYILIDVNHF